MALTERIETLLVGNATGLVNSFKQGGTAAEGLQGKTTTVGKAMNALGLQGKTTGDMISTGLKVGAAAGGLALAKFALDGVQHFADVTSTVRAFQRVLGGTAEDSSRLAAATGRMGIDAGTAETAFGQLSKRIGEGKDTLKQWGVEIDRNKDGSVNFSKTLENISEKYVSIKDPAERAAFASENFGKGFMSINALLGQGKDNLQKFYDIAAEHHQIFSQDDLQKGLDYNRALHDLESAAQGLGLELGQMLIPALTGAAHIAESFVEVLDSIAGSSEGASIAAAAFGTAIGFAFGGPVGAAIGLTASLVGILGQGSDAMKTAADAADALAKKIDTLNTNQAVAAFDAYIHKAAQFVPSVDSARGRLKAFHDIANASPAAAQKLIDGFAGAGRATEAYRTVLDKAVQTQKEHKAAADASRATNDALTGSTNMSTGAIKAQTAEVKSYVKSLEDQKKAQDAANSALLASQGGEVGRQQAVIAATQAQNDYNDALASGDPTKIRDTSLALQQARLAEVSATDKANQSQQDYQTLLKDPTAAQTEIARLQGLIDKYGDADGAIQAQITKIQIMQYVLSQMPQTVTTNVVVVSDEAVKNAQAVLDALNALPQTVQIGIEVGALNAAGTLGGVNPATGV